MMISRKGAATLSLGKYFQAEAQGTQRLGIGWLANA
jgi:hypothetical protein